MGNETPTRRLSRTQARECAGAFLAGPPQTAFYAALCLPLGWHAPTLRDHDVDSGDLDTIAKALRQHARRL